MFHNKKRYHHRCILTLKIYYVLIFLSFFLLFSKLFYLITTQAINYSVTQDKATTTRTKDLRYKSILLWTRDDYCPFCMFGEGQTVFIRNECPVVNCYVTSDRTLMSDLTKCDAIAFNGRNIHDLTESHLPKNRSHHQKYIYFNLESARNQPVCDVIFDDFFNWTATYRFDSDIPFPYIFVKNSAGDTVGPKKDMKWMDKTKISGRTYRKMYRKVKMKTKAVAWFASNCQGRRMILAKTLKESLKDYDLRLDIYGGCGPYTCRKGNSLCDSMLEKDYYFYLAFENSNSKDYVSEKVLRALNHFTIPIVYGGANYSNFLPPHSYIDANKMSPQNISALIHRLISSPRLYLDYMWWRDHYSFHNNQIKGICAVCSALNDETMMMKHSVYKDFGRWWNPRFESDCLQSFVHIPMEKIGLDTEIEDSLFESERLLNNIYF